MAAGNPGGVMAELGYAVKVCSVRQGIVSQSVIWFANPEGGGHVIHLPADRCMLQRKPVQVCICAAVGNCVWLTVSGVQL